MRAFLTPSVATVNSDELSTFRWTGVKRVQKKGTERVTYAKWEQWEVVFFPKAILPPSTSSLMEGTILSEAMKGKG